MVVWLSFKFNVGDTLFTKEQQDHLLNLIYDNQEIFLLYIEEFCDELAHTMFTKLENQFTCLMEQFHSSYEGRPINACVSGSIRELLDHPRDYMPHKKSIASG